MRVLQRVAFKATGLRDGSYALFIAKPVRRGGRLYRCVAFLSASRPVRGGSDAFLGSVPDGVSCRGGGGAAVDFTLPIPLGRWRLYVCRPTPAAYCSARASRLGRAVTIRRQPEAARGGRSHAAGAARAGRRSPRAAGRPRQHAEMASVPPSSIRTSQMHV